MASAAPGILTAQTAPDVARRAWPRWLALGLAMPAVAATALLWPAGGGRLLLGATGAFLAVRGALLVRGAGTGVLDPRARALGAGAVVAGLAALAAAAVSAAVAGWVLLVAIPALLFAGAGALLARGGTARRGGAALLVWSLLVAAGLARGWGRAGDVATVVAGLAVAVLAVPVLVGAGSLRRAAARPAPAVPAGCAGCACGAGGCGALG